MDENETSTSYEAFQPYLFTVAYRRTGSASDAQDLVQDAWMRYLQAGSPAVASLRAYLTTIISRLALDYLKRARFQRERYVGSWLPEPALTGSVLPGPADTVEQREQVSLALLTLLERLGPEQRVVYVLREGFGLSHDEIATHVGKTAAACRQIYHRAQQRLAHDRRPTIAPLARHQRLIDRFLEAISTGNTAAAIQLLAKDAVWIGDGGAERLTARRTVVGADRITRGMIGVYAKLVKQFRATIETADINGAPAIIIWNGDTIDHLIALDVADDRIIGVRVVVSTAKLRYLERGP